MPIKTLLLVDDDEDDHELFRLALAQFQNPADFIGAHNGMDALEKLDSKTVTPDLIFLDINMPILNGFATLQQLKENKGLRHIPVVMYSTSFSLKDERKAIELGAVAFLKKPDTLAGLHQLLKSFFSSFRGK